MIPKIFSNFLRNPMDLLRENKVPSPFISSLSFRTVGMTTVHLEIVSEAPLGEDVVWILPQVPNITESVTEVDYELRLQHLFPECGDVYRGGLFTNSYIRNLNMFDKYDMLYIPPFYEAVTGIKQPMEDVYNTPVGDRMGYLMRHIEVPPIITGTVVIPRSKLPTTKIVKKQRQRALRSGIFK